MLRGVEKPILLVRRPCKP